MGGFWRRDGEASEDVVDFFELLSLDETIRFGAKVRCDDLGASLRAAAKSGTKTDRIRLAHSLGGSIASQIGHTRDGLGGADRLTIVSPFYDLGGGGIDDLAKGIEPFDDPARIAPFDHFK